MRGGQREQSKLKYRAVCAVCHCSPMGKSNTSAINHLTRATSHESLLENRAAGGVKPLWRQGMEETHKTHLMNTNESIMHVRTNALSLSPLSA